MATSFDYSVPAADKDRSIVAKFREVVAVFFTYLSRVEPAADGLPHGTITPDGSQQVAAGASVSYNVLADPGYEIESVTDNGVEVFAV